MTRSAVGNAFFVIKSIFKYHKTLIFMLLLFAITQGTGVLILPVISKLVLGVAESGGDISQLISLLLPAALIVLVLQWIGALTVNRIDRHIELVRTCFSRRRVSKSFELDYELLEQSHILDMQRKAMEADSGVSAGLLAMMTAIKNLLSNLVGVVVSAIIIADYSPYVIGWMVVICIVRMLAMNAAKKYDKKYVWDMMAPFWRRIDFLYQSAVDIRFAKDIRVYAMKPWLLDKHKSISAQAHGLISKSKLNWIRFTTVNQLLVFAADVVLYGWLILSAVNGQIAISDFTLCYGAIYAFVESTNRLFENIVEIRQTSLQVDDYRNFVELPDDSDRTAFDPIPNHERFRFICRNLSFKYPGHDTYALKNINLTINAGQKLAVVGLNGAGKTTLIKLLLRLYEPTEGAIYLNGIDIRSFNKSEYYALFSPVFQDVEPLALTILENVSMRKATDSDRERAEQCMRDAGLRSKLTMLHGGLDAHIGKFIYSDGTDFSGGEKQKLMLARALYKDAPIVIMDEPTAALDALAESKQYESFNLLIGSKTAIYISHRLSSTKFCDAIAMFDNGEIVEYGTHEELLALKGRYAELFEVQAQYYKDKSDEE